MPECAQCTIIIATLICTTVEHANFFQLPYRSGNDKRLPVHVCSFYVYVFSPGGPIIILNLCRHFHYSAVAVWFVLVHLDNWEKSVFERLQGSQERRRIGHY